MLQSRTLSLSFTSNVTLSTGVYDGKEHLIIPVIGLVGDIVVYPSNGNGAEFVPASILADFPKAWNGRPVTYNHPPPTSDTANKPELLDSLCFGRLFDAKFENNSIKFDAWVDEDKASEIGASEIVDRARSLKPIEVSTGVFVYLEKKSGVAPNGDKYDYIWLSLVPDHLAMLEDGAIGACSNEDGCGAPRLNQRNKNSGNGNEEIPMPEEAQPNKAESLPGEKRSLLSSFLSFFRSNAITEGDSLTDNEVRTILWRALYQIEPGLTYIEDVLQQESFVIYGVIIGSDYYYFRRSYTLDITNRTTTVADDKVQVMLRSIWVPLSETGSEATSVTLTSEATLASASAIAPSPEIRHNCTCGQNANEGNQSSNQNVSQSVNQNGNQEVTTMSENQNANATPSNEATPTTPVIPTTPTASAPSPPRQLTKEEWLAQAPTEYAAIFVRAEREEANRRSNYISLLSTKQTHLSKEILATKSTEQLEELISVLGIDLNPTSTHLNYSGRGLITPETEEPKTKRNLGSRMYGYNETETNGASGNGNQKEVSN